MSAVLWLLILLQVKHFVCDFPLQGPYQYLNKGTYGHPGGLLHALIHGIGTAVVFLIFYGTIAYNTEAMSVLLAVIWVEMVIHYHIDWVKMNLNKTLGWGPTTHEQFWWLLGLDQLLHQLTYLGMITVLFSWWFWI